MSVKVLYDLESLREFRRGGHVRRQLSCDKRKWLVSMSNGSGNRKKKKKGSQNVETRGEEISLLFRIIWCLQMIYFIYSRVCFWCYVLCFSDSCNFLCFFSWLCYSFFISIREKSIFRSSFVEDNHDKGGRERKIRGEKEGMNRSLCICSNERKGWLYSTTQTPHKGHTVANCLYGYIQGFWRQSDPIPDALWILHV